MNYLEVFFQLILAIFLGGLVGIERSIAGKTAGLRTFALVSMGACLFVIISKIVALDYFLKLNFDPLRVASQIIVGIGFIGAGMIIFQQSKIQGLTTAAGLWVSAGIGMAIGFNLYLLALFASLLTLFVLIILWFFEEKVKEKTHLDEKAPSSKNLR